MPHAETVCTRCQGTRYAPAAAVAPVGCLCLRCRAVLAGRSAVDPLVTPESRERTAAARRSRLTANLTDQEPSRGAR